MTPPPEDTPPPESEYDDLLREMARATERTPRLLAPVFSPGDVVAGKLRVVRVLGEGGMGIVYEVEHELTRHRRALKVLRAGASASTVERFMREASVAARILDPHVIEVFDAGRLDDGRPYLLMELLKGETLKERLLRAGPIDAGTLADLGAQICEAVQGAHDAGIIHRDLKPENVFLTVREGQPFVKILDFGISKFGPGSLAGLTEEGLVLGTPAYIAPEQLRGGEASSRTDVYALGVVLYHCACGSLPYEARSLGRLADEIRRGEAIALARRAPRLPPLFCDVVHRAMAVDPAQRFESARALGEALLPLRARRITSVRSDAATVRPPARPRAATIGTAAAVAAALAGVFSLALASRPARPPHTLAARPAVPAVAIPEAPEPPAAELPRLESPSPELAPPRSAAVVSAPPSRPARPPSPAGAPSSRASRTGLVGDNPFR